MEQLVAPGVRATVPAAQASHLAMPALLANVPIGQGLHEVQPAVGRAGACCAMWKGLGEQSSVAGQEAEVAHWAGGLSARGSGGAVQRLEQACSPRVAQKEPGGQGLHRFSAGMPARTGQTAQASQLHNLSAAGHGKRRKGACDQC